MSSTVSTAEVRTLTAPKPLQRHEDGKRLQRTSSLEKIRRFNSFICSQQYFVLPALLTWLKTSQSGLQSSAEKTIFFFRALIFSNGLYKLYQWDYKATISAVIQLLCRHSALWIKMGVIGVASVLLVELSLCFYILCVTFVPSGLIFLIVCIFYIIYLNVKSCYRMDRKSVIKKKH